MLDSLMLYLDLHIGVTRWREQRIVNRRVKGVWDDRLEREYLRLQDGRILTYFLDGPRSLEGPMVETTGLPYVFVFHAMFLSANSFLMAEPPKDCVLVGVNRPGYFGSDAPDVHATKPYTFETFASDIEQLADHLQLETFFVAGHSSGGPCALACAAYMPRRVKGVAILSGDPEYADEGVPDKKWVNRCCVGCFLPFVLERMCCCLPVAQGARLGLRNDYRLDTTRHSFRTEDIQTPVHVFVGLDDKVLPYEISRHVHERLKRSTLHMIPKVGHLGLLRDNVLQDIVETLIYVKDEDDVDCIEHLPEAALEIPRLT
mmetsp:Transcript_14746/g.28027  ORF Transcript_14746/g.28027 Transcript_14746/m.28027 type:complete len:316 (-) Transcript_14746:106-1053(-)